VLQVRHHHLHQGHPGQDHQQVQGLWLRGLRVARGGREGGAAAAEHQPAGPDGEAAGAGPHQPVPRQPAARHERVRAGGAAAAARQRHLHAHPAGRPHHQPRRRLCQAREQGDVREGDPAVQQEGAGRQQGASPRQVRRLRQQEEDAAVQGAGGRGVGRTGDGDAVPRPLHRRTHGGSGGLAAGRCVQTTVPGGQRGVAPRPRLPRAAPVLLPRHRPSPRAHGRGRLASGGDDGLVTGQQRHAVPSMHAHHHTSQPHASAAAE